MNTISRPRSLPTWRAEMLRNHGWSFAAVLLFIIGLSVFGSGFLSTRIRFRSLYIHPYLLIVALIFPLVVSTRLKSVPLRLLLSLTAFASLYIVSTFAGGASLGEIMKIGAAVATILTMYMLVDRYKDFELGVLGLLLAVTALGFRALLLSGGGNDSGFDVIESANRNTYSLYALGPILLSLQILLRYRPSAFVRLILMACIGISSIVIILTLNRSGWLGLGVIVVMMLWRNQFKGAALACFIGSCVIAVITTVYDTQTISNRVVSKNARQSDASRIELLEQSMLIGLENPLLGVSPFMLEYQLARHFGYERGLFAAHNVYGYLAGASGLICLGLLFWIGRVFWTWPPPTHAAAVQYSLFVEARSLLRMMIVLWAVRGFFTHEILFSPGFCMSLGLAAGLCNVYARGGQVGGARALRMSA